MTKRTRALVVSAVAGSALVAVAGPALAKTYNVTAGDLFFRSVPKTVTAGKHTFVLKNTGQAPHNFKIAGKSTRTIMNGQTASVTVTLKKGKANYLCTIPGHAQAGMKGTITVK